MECVWEFLGQIGTNGQPRKCATFLSISAQCQSRTFSPFSLCSSSPSINIGSPSVCANHRDQEIDISERRVTLVTFNGSL